MLTESAKLPPSCANDIETGVLSVDEARRRILADITPLTALEKVALRAALGRILAEDVISPLNVPSHTNSAMDGYAVNFADLNKSISQFKESFNVNDRLTS